MNILKKYLELKKNRRWKLRIELKMKVPQTLVLPLNYFQRIYFILFLNKTHFLKSTNVLGGF